MEGEAKIPRLTGPEEDSDCEEQACSSNSDNSDELTSAPCGGALEVDLVVNTILNFMTTPELLQCSLVNKQWRHEARKILREKRRCFARMRPVYPCKDLQRFDATLEHSDPLELPFNGLYLPVDSRNHSRTCLRRRIREQNRRWVTPDVQYGNIKDKLYLKYLHMEWIGENPMSACPAVVHFPKFITRNMLTLEEFCLINFPTPWDNPPDRPDEEDSDPRCSSTTEFWTNSLPKLKIIRGKDLEIEEFMRPLCGNLFMAPNLEEFLVVVTRDQLGRGRTEEIIPQARHGVIKSLCFDCRDVYDVALFYIFSWSNPRLRNLIIKYPVVYFPQDLVQGVDGIDDQAPDGLVVFNEQFSWQSLVSICRSSSETLEKLRLPATVAVELMNREWLEFPNVTYLVLEVPIQDLDEEQVLHQVLRRFNFTARFPKLTAITVDDPSDNFYEVGPEFSWDFYELRADLPEDTTVQITSLTVNEPVTEFGLQYLATLFPHITKLELSAGEDRPRQPYSVIWREWPQLEKLVVAESHWGFDPDRDDCRINYDAEFMGLHEEEARQLQQQPLESLRDLHIVPIKPALTTMKNLKELTVSFLQIDEVDPFAESNYFLSRAACILSVNRMANLNFKLICWHWHGTWAESRGDFAVVPLTRHVNVERAPPIFDPRDPPRSWI